ncbi:Uncharacterised protein [Propionibacterium australiense]|uniref:Uncharacterized protein n=1 Tax=Propionibacterium australiense TaxID=119981 RepID=A0A383S7P0_9ACTN|nr:Hypothetical protein PROPAUS_1174 [Propionibacterium australiense]VEH89250.1 Uncharacterised protein [Propionibacterium australiense]
MAAWGIIASGEVDRFAIFLAAITAVRPRGRKGTGKFENPGK